MLSLLFVLSACDNDPMGTRTPRRVAQSSVSAHDRAICGTIAGLGCPAGQICAVDPFDECSRQGGADCKRLCVPDDPALRCGGFAGVACPAGVACTYDPQDECTANHGADCQGFCITQ
jgi:hypothetical protein